MKNKKQVQGYRLNTKITVERNPTEAGRLCIECDLRHVRDRGLAEKRIIGA